MAVSRDFIDVWSKHWTSIDSITLFYLTNPSWQIFKNLLNWFKKAVKQRLAGLSKYSENNLGPQRYILTEIIPPALKVHINLQFCRAEVHVG